MQSLSCSGEASVMLIVDLSLASMVQYSPFQFYAIAYKSSAKLSFRSCAEQVYAHDDHYLLPVSCEFGAHSGSPWIRIPKCDGHTYIKTNRSKIILIYFAIIILQHEKREKYSRSWSCQLWIHFSLPTLPAAQQVAWMRPPLHWLPSPRLPLWANLVGGSALHAWFWQWSASLPLASGWSPNRKQNKLSIYTRCTDGSRVHNSMLPSIN